MLTLSVLLLTGAAEEAKEEDAWVGAESEGAPKVNLKGDGDEDDESVGVVLLVVVVLLVAVVSILLSAVVGQECLRCWALDGSILDELTAGNEDACYLCMYIANCRGKILCHIMC